MTPKSSSLSMTMALLLLPSEWSLNGIGGLKKKRSIIIEPTPARTPYQRIKKCIFSAKLRYVHYK